MKNIIKKNRLIARIKVIFFAVIVVSLSTDYMFQSPTLRTRQRGDFPIVKFKTGDLLSHLSISGFKPLATVKKAAAIWFAESKAQMDFQYDGESDTSIPFSPAQMNCSENTLLEGEKPVFVGSLGAKDPDCTAEICTYNWICVDEIVHSDILFKDKAFSAEVDPLNLQRLEVFLAHSFGHAAGLSHCAHGDTEKSCESKIGDSRSNPPAGSLMEAFPSSHTLELHSDDIAGIEKLYGKDSSGFAHNGANALSNEETVAISMAKADFKMQQTMNPNFKRNTMIGIGTLSSCEATQVSDFDPQNPIAPYEPRCTNAARNRAESQKTEYFNTIKGKIGTVPDHALPVFRANIMNTLYLCNETEKLLSDEASAVMDSYSWNSFKQICDDWNNLRNLVIQEENLR